MTIPERITLTNQKGGIGKTTLATNLARGLAARGKRVLFVDFDVQGNAGYALNDFVLSKAISSFDLISRKLDVSELNGADLSSLTVIPADPRLADCGVLDVKTAVNFYEDNLTFFADKFDTLILDTPPTLSNTMMIALLVSKYVLIPIEVETFSLLGLQTLLTTINNTKRYAPNLKILGLVLNKVSYNKPRHIQELKNIRTKLGGLVFNSVIANRDSIAEAQKLQCDLKELRKKAARKAIGEFDAFCDEVMEKIQEGR